jgi:hypothetical protein
MKNLNLEVIREKKQMYHDFIEKVKTEMILSKVYYKKAKFQCFTDSEFTYGYSTHSVFYEFTFICDDTLLDKMTIKDLLELKNVEFFQNRIFCKQTRELLVNVSFSFNNLEE